MTNPWLKFLVLLTILVALFALQIEAKKAKAKGCIGPNGKFYNKKDILNVDECFIKKCRKKRNKYTWKKELKKKECCQYKKSLLTNGMVKEVDGEMVACVDGKIEEAEITGPTNAVIFDESQFWLSVKFQMVNWTQLMLESAPFLNEDEREVILNTASYDNINPLIIITNLVLQQEDKEKSPSTDIEKFSQSIGNMSKSLLDSFKKYGDEDSSQKPSPDTAFSTLWETLGEDHEKLEKFLDLYQNLFAQYIELVENPFEENHRNEHETFSLTWPWPIGHSWKVGRTHGQYQSALDMYLGGHVCNWVSNPSCTENTPYVYAMHSGIVSPYVSHSRCSLRILHKSGMQTKYYHMDTQVFKAGTWIEKGQVIGKYAGDKATALCEGGMSTGPHLHIDLFNQQGTPVNLHGWSINGYKIYAYPASTEYDIDCTKCWFRKNGQNFCPTWNIPHDPENNGCQYTDYYPNDCPGWKNPYCTSGQWASWMATYCAKTCKCGSTCSYTDTYPNGCPGWKNPHCTSGQWVTWMATYCAKTCKC